KLEPGITLSVNEHGHTVKKVFNQAGPSGKTSMITGSRGRNGLPQVLEKLEAKISDCIKIGLRSDVPLGVFLSSGIDSSIVSYFAKKHKPDLKTFTVYFKEESFSERKEARMIADSFGTDHTEILMEVPENLPDFVSKVLAQFDEPFGDASALPTYLLCEAARRYVTVSLSGDGGDELFGGYPTFIASLAFKNYWSHLPSVLRKKVFPAFANMIPMTHNKVSLDYKLKRFTGQAGAHDDWREAHFAWRGAFGWGDRENIYTNDFHNSISDRLPYDSVINHFSDVKGEPALDQLLYADQKSYLLDAFLVKMDRMSMAHSLEVRPPFLDPELGALAWEIDGAYKIKGMKTKWILRHMMKGRLPEEARKLPKKGFSPPLAMWFLDPKFSAFFKETCSSSAFRNLGIVSPAAVDKYLDEHIQKKADRSRQLWVLLGLALFAQRRAGK
ncbi:asparagine synthetase B family protein, partial [Elusimicrobiota bacterium]